MNSKRDHVIKKLSKVKTFASLSKKELVDISRLMTQVNLSKGRVLTRQGARGTDFMIIMEGKASVKRNNRKVAELGPGDFMGELAIVSGAPRVATVEATTDMVVQVLSRREFMSLLDKTPRLTKNILISAIKRLQSVESSKVS